MTTSTQEQTKQGLLAEFDKPTYDQWKQAAVAALKGADFDRKLLTKTIEGLTLQPIYNASDVKGDVNELPASATSLRGASASGYAPAGWDVAQEIPCGDPKEFNAALLEDLSRGQTALNLLLDVATQKGIDPDSAAAGEVGVCGLSLCTTADLQNAFKGVVLTALPTYFQSGMAGVGLTALLGAYMAQAGIDGSQMQGSYDLDPLASYLRTGTLPLSVEQAYDEVAAVLNWSMKATPNMGVIGIQAGTFAESGANAIQDLSYTLSATVAYVEAMSARGIEPQQTLKRTRWLFSVGPHFFTEVAKFRAARVLWANLLRGYGLSADEIPAALHARTGIYHKTVYDPHVNMLRTSMESFAAVVGGIQSLHIGPYDEILNEPTAFSRRIARNTHTVLREESGLDKIIDPAGGSYYVEALTDEFMTQAWEDFQGTQKAGGYLQAITSGELQKAIAATAAARQKLLAQRRDVLVGTNLYAVANETPKRVAGPDYESIRSNRAQAVAAARTSSPIASDTEVLKKLENIMVQGDAPTAATVEAAIAAAQAGATLGEITRALRSGATAAQPIQKLPYGRLAQPYETLRATAAMVKPKVFLATMGPLRQHKARADFIQSFLEAGAIEVIYPNGFDSADEAAKAFGESGAKVAVICSTDDDYPTSVPAVSAAIKSVSPDALVWLAGQPAPDQAEAYAAAGLDNHISVKTPHLETLQTIVTLYQK